MQRQYIYAAFTIFCSLIIIFINIIIITSATFICLHLNRFIITLIIVVVGKLSHFLLGSSIILCTTRQRIRAVE